MLPETEKRVFRILIVDDEAPLRALFSMALEALDYESVVAEGGAEALDKIGSDHFDLILLDLSMPGVSGLDVLRTMRERGDMTRVVILSAFIPGSAIVAAASYGVTNFLGKPITLGLLRETVAKALHLCSESTPLEDAKEAAAALNFEKAESLLATEKEPTPHERLWLKLYRKLASGRGLEHLQEMNKGFERLVRHQRKLGAPGSDSLPSQW